MEPPDNFVQLREGSILQLSEIIDSVKINYTIAFKTKENLEALQSWVTQQKALYDSKILP